MFVDKIAVGSVVIEEEVIVIAAAGNVTNQAPSEKSDGDCKSIRADGSGPRSDELPSHEVIGGAIARLAGVSPHSVRRAAKAKATASPDEIAAVLSGDKTVKELRPEVLKKPKARARGKARSVKPKKIDHPFIPKNDFEHDALAGWVRLIESKLSVTEKARARRVFRDIFKAEEKSEGQNGGAQ